LAWIGLVPKLHSSGGWATLGTISKQGDRYLRGLFVAGALAIIRYAKLSWHQISALGRRIAGTAADQSRCHSACQLARMAWAMMATGERYNYPASLRV